MSRGPDPEPKREAYKDTVEALYDDGATNETGGVPAYAVAAELDVPLTRAAYHLDNLVDRDELEDRLDFPGEEGGRYKRGFVPVAQE